MNTKTNISIGSLLLVSAGLAHADLTFSAPSMETPHVNTQLNKNWSQNLGNYWKYVITGYEYRLNAGVPDGGKVSGNALRYKTSNASFPGRTTLTASINGKVIASATLNASLITDSKSKTQGFTTPVTVENQDIRASYSYSSNMIGGADYILLHGAALTAPPVPVGSLIAPSYVRDGSKPTLEWYITKTLGAEVIEVNIPPATETESSNSGHGKSNNGHGNNADGIDSSNPGKSAAKWAEKGLHDTDYDGDGTFEDDESGGGGSAISKNKNTNP